MKSYKRVRCPEKWKAIEKKGTLKTRCLDVITDDTNMNLMGHKETFINRKSRNGVHQVMKSQK